MNLARDTDRDALASELIAIFPAPGHIERVWLYTELQAILKAAPWVRPHVGGDAIDHVLEELRLQADRLTPSREKGASITLLVGKFGNAGAIIGHGTASAALRRLAGLVWIALRRWWSAGHLPCTVSDELTSAVRAAIRDFRSKAFWVLDPVLAELKSVEDMQGAIRAMSRLESSPHQSLRHAWNNGLRQILTDERFDRGVSERPIAKRTSAPAPPRPSDRVHSLARPIDRGDIHTSRPAVFPLRRRLPAEDATPGEPCEELGVTTDLVIVPGYGTGAVSRKRAEYEARQAIWSDNLLLLPSHVEALPSDVFGAALRALVAALERDNPLAPGHLVCLLKGLTGRTTAGIRWLCAGRPDLGGAGIDLDRGVIEFPAFWKVGASTLAREGAEGSEDALGYFSARTVVCAERLEPVENRICLPMPAPIQAVLIRHRKVLGQLAQLDELELDRLAAEADDQLAASLGVPLTAASLRRSLGPQVMEVTGDLALAQLVCGDSFGRPLALQHYYAPRRSDLADAYDRVVSVHLQEHVRARRQRLGGRVGSELLLTPEAARELAQSSKKRTADGLSEVVGRHRHMVDHLARMFFVTTGHRPSEAIFELTLHDLDLQTGAALFRDKKIDVAHDPRLAALPKVVCQQLEAYLRHLSALSNENDECRGMVDAVRIGAAPLLFDLDEATKPQPMALATLKVRSPPEWNQLPWNWGRTYLRTCGIEAGAPAFLMSCQLGHLDAVGYPYSSQSPTTPAEVICETRPWLDQIARIQGWRVIPFGSSKRQAADQLPHPALRDWTMQLTQMEKSALDAHRQWELALRRHARQARDRALQQVLEHPDLVRAGVTSSFNSESALQAEPLDGVATHRIHAELVDAVGDDAPAAIAVTRALRRVLATVSRKTGQAYPVIPLPIAIRRPLDNPFLPGACLAMQQMHALRGHVAARSSEKKPERPFLMQLARTAEALALFGFVEDADRLVAILGARANAVPSSRLVDCLLVPLGDGQVVILRGNAALALANLARCYPSDPMPPRDELGRALHKILPSWVTSATDSDKTILTRLCSTAAIANRFELSPAARFAVDRTFGSTHASLAEQLAYIDSDPVGPERAPSDAEQEEAGQPERTLNHGLRPDGSETPRFQYRRLCRAIPSPYQDTHLPLTRRRIRATERNTASARVAIMEELDCQLRQDRLFPIVRMLGSWIRAEAQRSGGTAKPLAYRTIETYLTRIGGALVEMLGDPSVATWTEERLEDAYLYALDASKKARHKVAAALLSFHRHCSRHWDLPDMDLSILYSELGPRRQSSDAHLILPVELNRALEAIRRRAWESANEEPAQVRMARSADWVSYFLAWGGARLSESLGLQARDVGMRPGGLAWTTIRPNRMRPLKTRAATRALEFEVCALEVAHRERVLQRVNDVRLGAGARRPGSTYLLHDGNARGIDEGVSADAVAQWIRRALAEATGRRSERLHRLRHLAASQRILKVMLDHRDQEAMGLEPAQAVCGRVLMPRDLHGVSIAMGHAHWRTTLQWYMHLPALLQSRAASSMRDTYFSRQFVAGTLGITAAGVDFVLRERHADKVSAWFSHFGLNPRNVPEATRATESPSDQHDLDHWTSERIGRLVKLAASMRNLEAAARLVGAPLFDLELIVECAERWEAKLGMRLLPKSYGGKNRRCPPRAIRNVEGDGILEGLWKEVDEARDEAPYRSVVDAFFVWAHPGSDHAISLPAGTAHELEEWLMRSGINADQIETTPGPGGLLRIQVLRRTRGGTKNVFHDMGLRLVLAATGMALELRGRAKQGYPS